MTSDKVVRVLNALPLGLKETLKDLAGAPLETVETVFGLLSYDQRTAAETLGLAVAGDLVDAETGIHPLVPTQLAMEVLAAMSETTRPEMTLDSFRIRAKELIDRIPTESAVSGPAAGVQREPQHVAGA